MTKKWPMAMLPQGWEVATKDKRDLQDGCVEVNTPSKTQKISIVTIGFGVADKMGVSPCLASYEEDLMEMMEAYSEQQKEGKRFVLVLKKILQPPRPQGDAKFNRWGGDVLGELVQQGE